MPFGLAALPLLIAVIGVGIVALAKQAGELGSIVEESSPIDYDGFFDLISTFVILFCAAQGPELLGRDQRYSVLPCTSRARSHGSTTRSRRSAA